MNPEQIQSAIRSALLFGPGAALIAHGILSQDQANQLAPTVALLAYTGVSAVIGWWGVHSHSAPAITAAVNSNSAPGVKVVPETSTTVPAVNLDNTGAIKPVGSKP